jgi:hypothetical protein
MHLDDEAVRTFAQRLKSHGCELCFQRGSVSLGIDVSHPDRLEGIQAGLSGTLPFDEGPLVVPAHQQLAREEPVVQFRIGTGVGRSSEDDGRVHRFSANL